MPKVIIADTSCFILLKNIGELDLLFKLYGNVTTTPEVEEEFGEKFPTWVEVKSAKDKYHQPILEMQVDKGEASAIALALENPDCKIILDDYKARKVAERLNLNLTGTVGVIVKAKLNGHIPSIKPLLLRIRNTNFRISPEIEQQALKEAKEVEE